MQALVLEKIHQLALRDIQLDETLGAHDVRIRIHTCLLYTSPSPRD